MIPRLRDVPEFDIVPALRVIVRRGDPPGPGRAAQLLCQAPNKLRTVVPRRHAEVEVKTLTVGRLTLTGKAAGGLLFRPTPTRMSLKKPTSFRWCRSRVR